MATTTASESIPSWRYVWGVRWRLWRQNALEFWRELHKHPISVAGGVVMVAYVLAALFAEQITWHNPELGSLRNRLLPPAFVAGGSWDFPLGTDAQGRDLYTRIVFGARVSLAVGILSVAISMVVGVALGALAGYRRGRIDGLILRFADLLMAFPFLIFAIGMMAFLGPGFVNLILALTFKGWVEFFRLARGDMIAEGTREYVEAARVTGQKPWRIVVGEMLPNILPTIFVLTTLRIGFMIVTEASLSFLGLGIQPPTPAWGSMVADGRNHLLNAWWVSTMPGLAIVGLVLAINLFGEGLRDILDPRLKLE